MTAPEPREEPWEWHPDGPEKLAEDRGEREGVVDGERLVWSDEGEEATDQGMRCDAQYGQNPDRCYLQFNHRGPHSNHYGTTWTRTTPPAPGDQP